MGLASERVCHLALEDELEGEGALAGQVGVAFRVVDAGLQHPGLVEDGEARRLVVQAGDEVICTIWPELDLYMETWGGRGGGRGYRT